MTGNVQADDQHHAQRRLERWAFLLVFACGAWFYNGANWNQVSRLDMILSFVEPGTPDSLTFRIDRFITDPEQGINTGDWASNPLHDHHFYSNKAPGLSLAGIPVYAVIWLGAKIFSIDLAREGATAIAAYLVNLLVTVLPLALAVPLMIRLLRRLGAPPSRAVTLALILFPGSLLFPFSTQLWGHASAAACLVFALYFLVRLDDPWSLAWCGLWAGLAVLIEYSCAISVVAIGVYILLSCQRRDVWRYALGGALPLTIFLLYHAVCFGSPFATGNLYNNPHFQESGALMGGFGAWRPDAWWGLTFSVDRGLFWYSPVLILVLPGAAMLRPRREHSIYWLAAANVLGFFLMNLSFNGWHGGASTGPRYLLPVLPFAVLLLNLIPRWHAWRWPAWGLMAWSTLNALTIAATTTMIPYLPRYHNPLPKLYLALAHGVLHFMEFNPLRTPPTANIPAPSFVAFNLGEWCGLHGLASLLPLLAIIAILAICIVRTCQKIERASASETSSTEV